MYIDTKFNSLLTALANIYINFNTTAMKMHTYIRTLDVRPSDKLVQGFEPSDVADSGLIEQLFGLQFTLTRSHLKAKPGSACAVTEDQVRWYQISWIF
jgi:hypothetical protein